MSEVVMPSGKYKGAPITGVPTFYLRKFIAHRKASELRDLAVKELERRGEVDFPNIEITSHAIDRASIRLGYLWAESSEKEEGLVTWLARMADEALAKYKRNPDRGSVVRVKHKSIVFVFELKYITPVLVSVWLTKSEGGLDAKI